MMDRQKERIECDDHFMRNLQHLMLKWRNEKRSVPAARKDASALSADEIISPVNAA